MIMQKNKFDIKTKERLPWQFKLLAILFIITSLLIISNSPVISSVLSFLALLIFTARGGLEIDMDNYIYREYMSYFFLLRVGKPVRFDAIEKIFINSGEVSNTMYTAHTSKSSTYKHQEYNAFIKFSNGDKIKIIGHRNKDDVEAYASAMAGRLKVPLVDYTSAES